MLSGPVVLLFTILLVPLGLILYVKQKTKGKMLCFFVREDKSLVGRLCELRDDFIIHQNLAYEVYPDFVRVSRYPMGWPSFFTEIVPTALYDERDAIPLDWVNIDQRLERAMELRAALDENWLRKLVHEAAPEGGLGINLKKLFPIALLVIGIAGVVVIYMMQRGG